MVTVLGAVDVLGVEVDGVVEPKEKPVLELLVISGVVEVP